MSSFDGMLVHPIADHLSDSKWERSQEKLLFKKRLKDLKVSEWVVECFPLERLPLKAEAW